MKLSVEKVDYREATTDIIILPFLPISESFVNFAGKLGFLLKLFEIIIELAFEEVIVIVR